MANGILNNNVVIASAQAAKTAKLHLEKDSTIYLIDAGDIAADTIPLKVLEPDGTIGGQYEFNGTVYQLDSSNISLKIYGPAIVVVEKGTTTNAVGVGVYSTGGAKIE